MKVTSRPKISLCWKKYLERFLAGANYSPPASFRFLHGRTRCGAERQAAQINLTVAEVFFLLQVIVDRLGAEKEKENLFEFNLQKSGVETEPAPTDTSDR